MKHLHAMLLSSALSLIWYLPAIAQESQYKVGLGSVFEVSASSVEGLEAFTKKPVVSITGGALGTKLKSVKIVTRSAEFAAGVKTVKCEFSVKTRSDTYQLVVLPKESGWGKTPTVVSSSFQVRCPTIAAASPSTGKSGDQIALTGTYFGTGTPKVSVEYTDAKSGKLKKAAGKIIKGSFIHADASGKASSMDVTTGESSLAFTLPAAVTATSTVCVLCLDNALKEGGRFAFNAGTLPEATTSDPWYISTSSAELRGLVNPNGAKTDCFFEYGLDTDYGSVVDLPDIEGGVGVVYEAAVASSLASGATYHFRLAAHNQNGRVVGEDHTFTTLAQAAPPTATTSEAVEVGTTGATPMGLVNPNNSATVWYFDYGLTALYGLRTPEVSAGAGSGTSTVSASVTGLLPGTLYHYRLSATNERGSSRGEDMTFTTEVTPPPPVDYTIHILQTGDLHETGGYLTTVGNYFKTYATETNTQGDDKVIYLDAGDYLTAYKNSPEFDPPYARNLFTSDNLTGQVRMFQELSQMNSYYDAMAIGNHDSVCCKFNDAGLKSLYFLYIDGQGGKSQADYYNLPIDAVNLSYKGRQTPESVLRKHVRTLTIGGREVKVLLAPACSSDKNHWGKQDPYASSFTLVKPYADEVKAAIDTVTKALGIDVVVLITHEDTNRLASDGSAHSYSDQQIMGEATNVDLIVGGHDHTVPFGPSIIADWQKDFGTLTEGTDYLYQNGNLFITVTNSHARKMSLIKSSSGFGRFIGKLDVTLEVINADFGDPATQHFRVKQTQGGWVDFGDVPPPPSKTTYFVAAMTKTTSASTLELVPPDLATSIVERQTAMISALKDAGYATSTEGYGTTVKLDNGNVTFFKSSDLHVSLARDVAPYDDNIDADRAAVAKALVKLMQDYGGKSFSIKDLADGSKLTTKNDFLAYDFSKKGDPYDSMTTLSSTVGVDMGNEGFTCGTESKFHISCAIFSADTKESLKDAQKEFFDCLKKASDQSYKTLPCAGFDVNGVAFMESIHTDENRYQKLRTFEFGATK